MYCMHNVCCILKSSAMLYCAIRFDSDVYLRQKVYIIMYFEFKLQKKKNENLEKCFPVSGYINLLQKVNMLTKNAFVFDVVSRLIQRRE